MALKRWSALLELVMPTPEIFEGTRRRASSRRKARFMTQVSQTAAQAGRDSRLAQVQALVLTLSAVLAGQAAASGAPRVFLRLTLLPQPLLSVLTCLGKAAGSARLRQGKAEAAEAIHRQLGEDPAALTPQASQAAAARLLGSGRAFRPPTLPAQRWLRAGTAPSTAQIRPSQLHWGEPSG